MAQILANDIPDIFLYYPDYMLAYNSQYQGWIPGVQIDCGAVSANSLAAVYIVSAATTATSTTIPTVGGENGSSTVILAALAGIIVGAVAVFVILRSRQRSTGKQT